MTIGGGNGILLAVQKTKPQTNSSQSLISSASGARKGESGARKQKKKFSPRSQKNKKRQTKLRNPTKNKKP